jgi:NAD(P) transhydrogenase
MQTHGSAVSPMRRRGLGVMVREMSHASSSSYDLAVVGSGPAGQGAALQAAALGARVVLVERDAIGGLSASAGMIPSQTLRAAVVALTGRAAAVYGFRRDLDEVAINDLLWRTQPVIEHESDAVIDSLRRSGVRIVEGTASFVDPKTLDVRLGDTGQRVHASRFVLAVGTVPNRPATIAFDGRTVLDSDEIMRFRGIPRTVVVIGAGSIGLEYASMLASLGVRVTLVERRPRILDGVDDELVEALEYQLRGLGIDFRLETEATAVVHSAGGPRVRLESGDALAADAVLYAAGRRGATGDLALAAAGLAADGTGRIPVDADQRTAQSHIFAAGDAVGVSAAAPAAIEQGRLAALAALGRPTPPRWAVPHAVYTLPELSFVGSTEQSLLDQHIPYVAGAAAYRNLLRGDVAGDRSGLLKLLVHAETRRILGVHILGTAAAELVHIGQAAMAGELTVDYFTEAVFNVPTFSDAYVEAALDACARLSELEDEAVDAA